MAIANIISQMSYNILRDYFNGVRKTITYYALSGIRIFSILF